MTGALELGVSAVFYAAVTRGTLLVAYLLITKRVGFFAKLLALGAWVSCALSYRHTQIEPLPLLAAGAYFALATCVVHKYLMPAALDRTLSLGATFVGCMTLFLAIPATALHGLIAPVLFMGWEYTLSAYSYCVESTKSGTSNRMRDLLFFVLVDPTLAYPVRSTLRESTETQWRGLVMVIGGAALQISALAIVWPSTPAARGADNVNLLLYGILRCLFLYWSFAGVAMFFVGLMHLSGFDTPPRYKMPFLAKNPADFWRRWNTYVTQWLLHYVFFPVMRLRLRFPLNALLPILATFVAIGLLHDLHTYFVTSELPMKGVRWFVGAAIVFIVWTAFARIARRLGLDRVPGSTVLARVVLVFGLVVGAAYWD